MRPYLIESQVPELGLLPRPVRRVVVRQALAMLREGARLFSWLPSVTCAIGGLAGAIIGAELLGYAAAHGYVQKPPGMTSDWMMLSAVWSYSGVGIGALLGGFAGLHLQRWKLRPYLRRAIEEHENIGNPLTNRANQRLGRDRAARSGKRT